MKKINELMDEEIHTIVVPEPPEKKASLEKAIVQTAELESKSFDEQSAWGGQRDLDGFSQFMERVAAVVDHLSDISQKASTEGLNLPGVDEKTLFEMTKRYETSLLKTCSEIQVLFQEFEKSPLDEMRRQKLSMQTHSLKGAGKSYGYPLVSTIAEAVEEIFQQKKTLNSEDLRNIRHHIQALSFVADKKLTGNGGKAGKLMLNGLKEFSEKT